MHFQGPNQPNHSDFAKHTFQMRHLSQYNRTHHQEYNIFSIGTLW